MMGTGVREDPVKAAALFQKACELDGLVGCRNLGILYAQGTGVERDGARATALFQKACDGDDMRGCTRLAWSYEPENGIGNDLAKAVALYQKACAPTSRGHASGTSRSSTRPRPMTTRSAARTQALRRARRQRALADGAGDLRDGGCRVAEVAVPSGV